MVSDELNFATPMALGGTFCSPNAGVSDATARGLLSAAGINSRFGTLHSVGDRRCLASIVGRIGQRERSIRCA
jgi:hypothetical protein